MTRRDVTIDVPLGEIASACRDFLTVWNDQHAEPAHFGPAVAQLTKLLAPGRVDEWCREEDCEYRHWTSGSMPTHKRGWRCPPPGGG